ncbi:MAG: hypothetical protein GX771_05325 [Halomonadaceae bacterium]|nr:hypothetical protein [Halomonadaceae bacterium]
MAKLIVTSAAQSETAIYRLLNDRNIRSLCVHKYHVTDFFGKWMKISRDPTGDLPYDGVASPRLTRQLKQLGIEVGDEVLVAIQPYVLYERCIRLVSPITNTNRHLIGYQLESVPYAQSALLSA